MKLKTIKKIENSKVYDITVEDAEHYILENGLVSHNSGLQYLASTIMFLSKKKEREGTEVVGNIVKASAVKARKSKENAKVETYISYKSGLNKYYGLVELAETAGLLKRVGNRYEVGDKKLYLKEIIKNPEEIFTQEFLQQINEAVKGDFMYGDSDADA